MIVATFVPGAVLAGANHTLPAEFPDLAAITNAQLIRVTAQLTATLTHAQLVAAVDDHAQAAIVGALADHAQAAIVGALADHAQAAIVGALADHAQAAIVGALADHAAHGHNITTVAAAGGGAALTQPLVPGPIETAAAPQVNVGAVDVLGAAQAHAAGAAAVAHAAGAAAVAHAAGAAAVAHAAGAAAVAHAAAAGGPVAATLTGADPTINVLAANITLVDRRTFSFAAQATALGDILILRYLEVGSYPRVA